MKKNFTSGPILVPLVQFALPVLLALFLQAMYGAVDLLIVGRFATAADVSAVATGSQLMMTITHVISGLSMGATILLGQQIGQGRGKEGGKVIGAGVFLFSVIGIAAAVILTAAAGQLAGMMHAPDEAFSLTTVYIRICGGGAVVIIAYNLIGSIFRGIGDSRTPLITVAIACVFNIIGDLFLVAVVHMGTAGAAIATVGAQFLSVVLSILMIKRKSLMFTFSIKDIHFDRLISGKIFSLGLPIALSDLLVGLSFLVIQAIVNVLGVIPSAGVGVAEKVCAFIMLVPSSFMQSLSAIVAQNIGAGKTGRAERTLKIGIGLSLCTGVIIGYFSFFHGDLLAGIFSNNPEVVAASADYLKAYAIDCLLTAFFFCFVGFYNGVGMTKFVMLQGIVSAFCVRIPVAWIMSRIKPVSLFRIGLATPASSILQIVLCIVYYSYVKKKVFPGLKADTEEDGEEK